MQSPHENTPLWPKRALLGIAALVAIVAILALALPDDDPTAPYVPPTREPSAPATQDQVAAADPPGTAEPDPDGTQPDATQRALAPAPPTALRLRCLGPGGQPFAKCHIDVAPWHDGAGMDVQPQWQGVTARDGTCRIELGEYRADCLLWFRSHRTATAWLLLRANEDDALERDLGDVRQFASGRVRLHTVSSDGSPVPHVRFRIGCGMPANGALHARSPFDVTTDATGTIEIDELIAAGPWGVNLQMTRLLSNHVFVVKQGRDVQDVTIQVEAPDAVILGTVHDERGEPVHGVRVWATADQRMVSNPCQTDERGTFVMARSPVIQDPYRTPEVQITAGSKTHEYSAPLTTRWGARDVRLTVRRGLPITILLRGPDGEPVESGWVQIMGDISSTRSCPMGTRQGSFPDGRVDFASLLRGAGHVRATPDDNSLVQLEEPLIQVADAGPRELTITLARAFTRELHVRTADGAPVAGSTFELIATNGRSIDGLGHVQEFASTRPGRAPSQPVSLHKGTTEEDGRAKLYGKVATGLALRVRGPEHTPVVIDNVRLDEPQPLEVTVTAGATVRVQLGPPELITGLKRSFTTGHMLRLSQSARQFFATMWPPKPAPITDDGIWKIHGVPAGTWSLKLSLPGGTAGNMPHHLVLDTFDIAAGATIERSYSRPDLVPATVTGRVTVDGTPPKLEAAVRAHIRSFPPEGGFREHNVRVPVADDGTFTIVGMAGDWTLRPMWRDVQHGRILAQAPDKLTLVQGQVRRVDVSLHMGTTTLTLRDTEGQPIAGAKARLLLADGRLRLELPQTDEQGRVESPLLECVPYTVMVLPRRLLSTEAQHAFIKEVGNLGRLELSRQTVSFGVVTPQPGGASTNLVAPAQFDN